MENLLPIKNLPFNGEWTYYISPRFITYRPKLKLHYQTEKYTLKTADSIHELVELFRLRHHIFLEGKIEDDSLDVDSLDSECDHILIKCNKTNEICGTYRIITTSNHVNFYSESEFYLDHFLNTNSIKMELGRACIHPYHRNGHVIDLLWRGIGEYAQKINAKHIFGCSSLPIISEKNVIALINYLKKNHYHSDEFKITTIGKYRYDLSTVDSCDLISDDTLKSFIPPLLQSYLNAGAIVHGVPAIDHDFDCLDFFTIINVDQIKSSYQKRYFK